MKRRRNLEEAGRRILPEITRLAGQGGAVLVTRSPLEMEDVVGAVMQYKRDVGVFLRGISPGSSSRGMVDKLGNSMSSPGSTPHVMLLEDFGSIRPRTWKEFTAALKSVHDDNYSTTIFATLVDSTWGDESGWWPIVMERAEDLGHLPVYYVHPDGTMELERVGGRAAPRRDTRDVEGAIASFIGAHREEQYMPTQYGACRRCAVCIQWDTRAGCCTACGGPLEPVRNPKALKRRLMR